MTGNAPSTGDERTALRRQLRARRRAIQGTARKRAAQLLAQQVAAMHLLRPGRRIGLYLSMPEEIDTAPLLRLARERGCEIALPRIISKRHDRMRFHEWNGEVRRGAYGIHEPRGGRMRSARELDVVFLPLVGFDIQGNRIGMGRGFYDRHFAHRLRMTGYRRPLLIGIAYDVQMVAALPRAAHDVPLDAIVTESSIRRFQGSTT
ncbi:MAG: 5-formyltetrahydrofolate cyclo-ligase [Pseudomonadota bacterium]